MTIEIKADPGNKRTIELMRQVEGEMRTKVVSSGLTAMAKPITQAMKSGAPRDTGLLQLSINRRRISERAMDRLGLFEGTVERTGSQIAMIIGPNRRVGGVGRARLAHLLEEGTDPHKIRPREKSGLLRLKKGTFAREVEHPGIDPTRFMSRALDESEGQLEDNFHKGAMRRLRRFGFT